MWIRSGTGSTQPSEDNWVATRVRSSGFVSGVFLSCKANARRSVHSLQDHFIITLIISND